MLVSDTFTEIFSAGRCLDDDSDFDDEAGDIYYTGKKGEYNTNTAKGQINKEKKKRGKKERKNVGCTAFRNRGKTKIF